MNVAGVYIQRDAAGALLYIGQCTDVIARTTAHRSRSAWGPMIQSVELIALEDQKKRVSVERELIRALKPMHNVVFKNLPTNLELAALHFVFTPHEIYDGARQHFGIASDIDLANFLGVTPAHILLVRLRMTRISGAEMEVIAHALKVPPYQVRWVFRKEGQTWKSSL